MSYCYYTCNLLPLDLVARGGYAPRWLGNHLRDPGAPARRDALSVHPMTCPFVTKLVAAAEEVLGDRSGPGSSTAASSAADGAPGSDTDCLVVPGGCDAMRRMGDLLAATYPDRVFVVHMPRSSGADAVARLAADFARLDQWLRDRLPAVAAADAEAPAAAMQADPPTVEYAKPPRPGGVFVVSGPLSNDSLLGLIDRLGTHVSGLESCTSPDRWKPLAPRAGDSGTAGPGFAGPDDAGQSLPDYQAFAAHVLATGMCPRRSTAERRTYLQRRLDETKPSSIIYARQSFCDPGAYDALLVAQLARERGLPYLEIEVDFPFDANGPLRVRVEAFLEAQLMDDDLLGGDHLFEEV
jgi:2-hydroxyglutaryl-CoA dehydratase, D-component